MIRILTLLPLLLLSLPWVAEAKEPPPAEAVSCITSSVVSTRRRTLHNLPVKRVIEDVRGWERVTAYLHPKPPRPDFAKGEVCLLVVADVRGGRRSWVERLERSKQKPLRVLLRRTGRTTPDNLPHQKAFFIVLPRAKLENGVKLIHRTIAAGLGGGKVGVGAGGMLIEVTRPPTPSDRDRRKFPQLGPDLRLSCKTLDGTPSPPGLKLRYETWYPNSMKVPGQIATIPFPRLGLPFPTKWSSGVTHLYAAHAPGYRSRNPLILRRRSPAGADGSPRPITHRFLLIPVRRRRAFKRR